MSKSINPIRVATERRTFLGTFTAASLGVILDVPQLAGSQTAAQAGSNVTGQIPFETSEVKVSENTIFVSRYGKGPAILMVHGFPRTSLIGVPDSRSACV
jgi:haloacetate dehalogenase